MTKTIATERKTVGIFAMALAVLCVVSLASVYYINTLLHNWDEVRHIHEVLDEILLLQHDLFVVSERGRSFSATPTDATFVDFSQECTDIRDVQARLRQLTADNPTQTNNLDLFLRRFNDIVRTTTRDADPATLHSFWTQSPLRPAFALVLSMYDVEQNLLADRDRLTRHTGKVALLTISAGGSVAVLMIIALAATIIRDLKRRRLAEAELQRAREAAIAANTAKSSFLANMSHELRTPLTAILGYSDLLMTPSTDQQERDRYLQTMHRSGEHLLAIINDILDLSKIEADRMQIETIDCRLVEILADVDSFMRTRASTKGITFAIDYASSIPDRVLTDPMRLRQILVNLVGNAIKFTEHGSVRLVIRYERDSSGGAASTLLLDVVDTGIGMTAEQRQAVFEPFAQADVTTTRRYGGTGLGLSISRRLASLMGGNLQLSSEPNRGSTFRLTLPVAAVPEAMMIPPGELSRVLAAQTPVASPRSALNLRVLLAEDGPENREVITLHLQRAGCEVVFAEDGQAACELIEAAVDAGNPFDAVLMDMQMPIMDGYTATMQLRARGYAGTIIALTANAMKEDRDRCLQAGCDEYAAKPVDVPHLLKLMEKATGKAAAPSVIATLLADPVFRDLTRKFCDSTMATLDALRAHLDNNHLGQVAAIAHKLAGAGGSYGFEDITREARTLERLANTPLPAPRGELEQQLERLDATCAAARETVHAAA